MTNEVLPPAHTHVVTVPTGNGLRAGLTDADRETGRALPTADERRAYAMACVQSYGRVHLGIAITQAQARGDITAIGMRERLRADLRASRLLFDDWWAWKTTGRKTG